MAVKVADIPMQVLTSGAVIVKFVTVALSTPGPPFVAPLGGNSETPKSVVPLEDVEVPLLPPVAIRVIAPEETAI